MPKGSKTCPSCSTNNGPRSFECKNCGHVFIFRTSTSSNRPRTQHKVLQSVSVMDLVKGDIIKVKPASYYITNDGNKYKMGEKGIFTFHKRVRDGIMATHRKLGYIFLYTGPAIDNTITGMHLRPHRIKKVIKSR